MQVQFLYACFPPVWLSSGCYDIHETETFDIFLFSEQGTYEARKELIRQRITKVDGGGKC